jgi:predicted transcriptional regulator
MDLNKLKELEDFKQKFAEAQKRSEQAHKPFHEKFFTIKKDFISSINDTFEKFFSSNGFEIIKSKDFLKAKYKNLEVCLKSPLLEEQSIGVFLVFDLEYNKTNHKLLVKREGEEIRSIVKITEQPPVKDQTQKEINDLKDKIEKINTDINDIGNLINSLNNTKVYFELIDKTIKRLERSKKFNSFEEILNIIFEK